MAVQFYILKKEGQKTQLVLSEVASPDFEEVSVYNSGYKVGFKAPTLGANQIWILPSTDGNNNDVLTTDGSGNLSWSIKGGAGGVTEAFKTIDCPAGTDPVADLAADTLQLLSGSNKISITGDATADSVTFDVVEANIDHDALTNFLANEHIDWTGASQNLLTSGSIQSSGVGGVISGDASNLGKVVIYDGSNHSITITSPGIAASYTLTLPTTDGDPNQLLQTDGAGVLSWITSVATDELVKVGAAGAADYLHSSYFERDAANHIRIKQNSLLTGVSAEMWAGQSLPADPGADRILFWDESVPDQLKWLTVSTGLSLVGTNLTTNDGQIIHDNLSGFVANEHIDWTNASQALHTSGNIRSDGIIWVNESVNARMTKGLTINQGAADDEIIALKSSDIDHQITAWAPGLIETDTWFSIRKTGGDEGGAMIMAMADASVWAAYIVYAYMNADADATKDSTAQPVIVEEPLKGNPATHTYDQWNLNANIWGVRTVVNAGGERTVFFVDEGGDYYYDGAGHAFQDEDDIELVKELEDILGGHISKGQMKEKNVFKKHKIVHVKEIYDKQLKEKRLDRYVSGKKLNMLLFGAIRQLSNKIETLERRMN